MEKERSLSSEVDIRPRFSEVDSMDVVWHGNYALYFEDAREQFGREYNFSYLDIYGNGYYAPLVELHFNYKKAIFYKDSAKIKISFRNTNSSKIIFDYIIYSPTDNSIYATGYSVQVFLDLEHKLIWNMPEFFSEWKKKWNINTQEPWDKTQNNDL